MKTTKLIDFARTLGFSCIIAASLTATNGRSATLLVYNTNNAGAGSLRQAIQDNNALGGGNTIVFSNTVTGTITLTSGELTITTNVTILGPGPEALTVSGNNASRIFRMTNSVVSLSGLQIRNGLAAASEGGGIANWGALSLSNCVVANCVGGNGGGVFNWGTLTVANSTIRNNSAGASSGGIASFGSLIVRGSSIISNAYTGGLMFNGGGIYGSGAITNCTIVANSGGDAAVIGGAATIWSSTIVSNISPGVAGGATVGNSIIARNGGFDVFGTFTSAGYNLIGQTNNSTGWGAVGDQFGTMASPLNPGLLPLGLYGGTTLALPPGTGSPALDQGKSLGVTADQRGRPRPIDHPPVPNATLGDGTDIGAVEVQTGPLAVTTTNDSGPGSLRQAILDVYPGENTVTIATNVFGKITLTSGELPISKNLNIVGPGAKLLAVSGNTNGRVFVVLEGTVAVSGLTICDGRVVSTAGGVEQDGAQARGGGIFNQTTLALSDCVISNCAAIGGQGGPTGEGFAGNGGNGLGGGIANIGTLNMTNCTLIGNSAAGGAGGVATSGGSDGMGGQGYGGGIYSFATNTLVRCAIIGNFATGGAGNGGTGSGSGGGIYNDATLRLLNSTVVSNAANGSPFDFGGGIYDNGVSLTVRSATISGNQADYGGGISTGGADLGNTILAGNSAGSGPDGSGTLNSSDYNLIQNTSDITISGTTSHNLTGQNPLLGPLSDNGGPTPTMAPLAGSPVIDRGKSFGLLTDQRGAPRPFDFASIGNAAGGDGSDIGAFESGSPILTVQKLGNAAVLSWPAYYGGFAVQSVTNVSLSNAWTAVAGIPLVSGNQYVFTNGPITGNKFYRLKGN